MSGFKANFSTGSRVGILTSLIFFRLSFSQLHELHIKLTRDDLLCIYFLNPAVEIYETHILISYFQINHHHYQYSTYVLRMKIRLNIPFSYFHGFITNQLNDQLPPGFLAKVQCSTGILEVKGSDPTRTCVFSGYLSQLQKLRL